MEKTTCESAAEIESEEVEKIWETEKGGCISVTRGKGGRRKRMELEEEGEQGAEQDWESRTRGLERKIKISLGGEPCAQLDQSERGN